MKKERLNLKEKTVCADCGREVNKARRCPYCGSPYITKKIIVEK